MANPIQTPASDTTNRSHAKRQKLADHNHHHHDNHHHEQPLIPGLPNHIAQLCLSLVHPSVLYSVCHSWRRVIYSPSFPPFLSLYTVLSSTNTDHNHCNSIHFFSFDPISSRWDPIPPLPLDPPLRLLLRHPAFISRDLPVQSISVCGNLILVAATTHNFIPALSRPLLFNPLYRTWSFGPAIATPRRWCAVGATHGNVYVASGVGSHFSNDVARSAEKWELRPDSNTTIASNQYYSSSNGSAWKWEKVKGLKDGRFSRDAIDAVGWRGKLCMVNMKGDAAKEGVVYDVKKDEWEEMPEGMIRGWKGPVAAMDEEVMFVVDEAKGVLKKYNPKKDYWEAIIESERLVGAQQIAAAGGRVCVVSGGGGGGGSGIVVVDVVALPVRMWVVDTPPGFEALAVHILPRMSQDWQA